MPWKIIRGGSDCPFEVVRADTGAHVACHPTKEKAMDHVAALYANVPENERADNTDTKKPYGDVTYADPGYQKDKVKRYPLDSADHCRAAWSYVNMPKNAAQYSAEQLASVKARIKAAAKRFGVEIADESTSNRSEESGPVEIETRERDIELRSVNYSQRLITVIATPYEEPALVEYRGEMWQEVFERGAWKSLKNARANRYRVNREHDRMRTVGRVNNLWPDREEGLVAEVRISNTPLGNETLELAADDCLSASVGFGVSSDGVEQNRATKTRRIKNAMLDHIAFTAAPAYAGATVLGVRSANTSNETNEQIKLLAGMLELLRAKPEDLQQQRRTTPDLDEFTGSDVFRWASERLRGE